MTPAVRYYTLQFRAANPARPMSDCYWSAMRHVHFRATLSADIKASKKRSAAAKKAWKTRRAAQS